MFAENRKEEGGMSTTERSVHLLLKTLGMNTPYACTGGISGGMARCRNAMPCPVHGEDAPMAPRPDVVLVKVNLSKLWGTLFKEAGVRIVDRTPERAKVLQEEHEKRAQQLGRSAYHIREGQKRQGLREDMNIPEAADSGCPVFGSDGLHEGIDGNSIHKVTFSLRDSGFRLVDAHRLQRNWKPPTRLVLVYERSSGRDVRFPWQLFQKVTSTTFLQVDVWANDRDRRGNVVHTVNCGKRDDTQKALLTLQYQRGDWGVTVVS